MSSPSSEPEKVAEAEESGVVDPESVITPAVVEAILKGANPTWVLEKYTAKPGTALGK